MFVIPLGFGTLLLCKFSRIACQSESINLEECSIILYAPGKLKTSSADPTASQILGFQQDKIRVFFFLIASRTPWCVLRELSLVRLCLSRKVTHQWVHVHFSPPLSLLCFPISSVCRYLEFAPSVCVSNGNACSFFFMLSIKSVIYIYTHNLVVLAVI